ncbi:MAG TPA: radical SAM protein [Gemmatimonadales bacterium]
MHIPFCGYRCHYCACNVTLAGRPDVADDYLDRLEREIDLVTEILGRERRPLQRHLGGGTPNFLTPAQFSRLSQMLESHFAFGPEAEHSLEADPRLVTREQLARLRDLCYRRISFGVQGFDPAVQAAIGRPQPEEVVREAVELARATGFEGSTSTWCTASRNRPWPTSSPLSGRPSRFTPTGSPATATPTCLGFGTTSG